MIEAVIGILTGVAVIVAAYLAGKNNAEKESKLESLEKENEDRKIADEIRENNSNTNPDHVRQWMRDNAKK